jgi:signal transduction histidine kinase
MDLDSDPLCISIRTRYTDVGTEIIVEDNGIGFDPSGESEPHIALKNIRQRLEMMCGGTLELTSREAGGTRVTIRVPLKNEE